MSFEPITACLVTDAEPIQAAVRVSFLPPHTLHVFKLDGLLNDQHMLSAYGNQVVEAAAKADVVLVNWRLEQAPVLDTLCYHVRHKKQVPVMALCGAGQEEIIAALSAGMDDVVTLPLYTPLLQARVTAYRRVVKAVRRTARADLKRKLKRLRKKEEEGGRWHSERLEHAVETVQETVEVPRADEGDAAARLQSTVSEAVEEMKVDLVDEVTNGVAEVLGPASRNGITVPLEVGPLRLNTDSFQFYINDQEVELTPKEFDLLNFLMQYPDRVCTRDEILDQVWGIDFDTGTNMVDVYMHFVRRKLEAYGLQQMIQTVRGRGYRMVPSNPMPA